MADLHVRLDAPLPRELAVGAGTALFVCGWCVSADDRIASLALVVDGAEQPVMEHGMPRLDVFRALHPGLDVYATHGIERDDESPDDPLMHGYRSGFWGIARVEPRAGRSSIELGLRARLDGGGVAEAPLGSIREVAPEAPLHGAPSGAGDEPLVAICMAAYNPPPELLRRQLDSIRAQTHRRWVCVVSDDCSDPASLAELERAIGGDERFLLSRSPRRLGFYRNFERALSLAPADAAFVAPADQDD